VAFLGSVVTKNNKHEKCPGVLLRFIAFILTTMLVVVCATGFGAQLSDEEIAAVINHERTQWRNASTQIKSDDVAAKR